VSEELTAFIVIFGVFIVACFIGMRVAFAFLLTGLVGGYIYIGAENGPMRLVSSVFESLSTFSLVPIPLFILLGEVLFRSGLAIKAVDSVGVILGRVPARHSLLALGGGGLFGALTGSTLANATVLGSLLAPDMRRRGYSKGLAFGPVMAAGGLAMIIPPSNLAIVYGTQAKVSIGRLLLAGLVPGLILLALYVVYIVAAAKLRPALAPPYEVTGRPLGERLAGFLRDILPLAFLIFLVTGLIVLGVATPTESAALGACGALLLAALYGRLSWDTLRRSALGTLSLTVMIFMIISGSVAFSQLLSFTGVTRAGVELVTNLDVPVLALLLLLILIVLFLGCFMDQVAIIMVAAPLFTPIVALAEWDPVWFGVLVLISLEIGLMTPPLGLILFVVKGIAPPDITMMDLYRAAAPFLTCNLVGIGLIIAFPQIALWLPSLVYD